MCFFLLSLDFIGNIVVYRSLCCLSFKTNYFVTVVGPRIGYFFLKKLEFFKGSKLILKRTVRKTHCCTFQVFNINYPEMHKVHGAICAI